MKYYNDYVEVLKKMELFKKTLQEMKEKKISEVSEDRIQQIADLAYDGFYDKDSEIWDLYFIDPDDVFSLFEELGEVERAIGTLGNMHPSLKTVHLKALIAETEEMAAMIPKELKWV